MKNKKHILFFILVVLTLFSTASALAVGTSQTNGDYDIYLPLIIRNPGTQSLWEEIGFGSASYGGISNNSGNSGGQSIAAAPDGTIYVAWQDDSSGHRQIYIRRWNGVNWEEVGAGSATGGSITNNSGYSTDASISTAPDGTPYIFWADERTADPIIFHQIYVLKWNGSSWVEVGTDSSIGNGISGTYGLSWGTSSAIAPDGTPYVAWYDYSTGDSEIYIRRWNGFNWEEIGTGSASGGGISDNTGDSIHPSLAINSNGTPYVSWSDNSSGNMEIYVRRWNGSDWEEVGTYSASNGGISNTLNSSGSPSLAISPDDTPYISWSDNTDTDYEIYVRRWNGNTWEEVGVNSASNGGISNNTTDSWSPCVSIAADGTPYISWKNDTYQYSQIYVLRWNGSNWEEVGTGSASDLGISQTRLFTGSPTIAIASNGKPVVAWSDANEVDTEIYVRQYVGD